MIDLMTREDKSELREIMHDIIAGYHAKVDAQGEITNERLKNIDNHLNKLNSEVASHEVKINEIDRKEALHVVNCPQTASIRKLEDNQLTTKAVRRWVVASIGITATVVTIIFTIFKIVTGSV
jgi:hypothetical protein